MMLSFENIPDLLAEVAKDSSLEGGSHGRYPIRFILLDDFHYYKELIGALRLPEIDLADKLERDDAWIGASALIDIVNGIERSSVIYPVSEVLRFYDQDKAIGFFASVFLRQNKGNIRVYVPLVGLKEVFFRFWENYNRKEEGPPVWYLQTAQEDQSPETVYLCDESINTKLRVLENNRQWLQYWSTDQRGPIITKTKSLKHRWSKFLPNGCFNKELLANPKDFLFRIHGIHSDKPYRATELDFWNNLLRIVEDTKNQHDIDINKIVERKLGISSLSLDKPKLLLAACRDSDCFDNWLLSVLAHQEDPDGRYLIRVLQSLTRYDVSDLVERLYYTILEQRSQNGMPNKTELMERKELIEALPSEYRVQVDSFIGSFLESLSDVPDQASLLTNFSIQERVRHFNLLLESPDPLEALQKQKQIRAYLDWKENSALVQVLDAKIIDYFHEYNRSKLLNRKTKGFDAAFNELNGDLDSFYNWYYSIDKLKVSDPQAVIQFDGVGVEWLPYILQIINDKASSHSKYVKEIGIRKAELPSITSLNKIEGVMSFVREYDQEIIHKTSGYKYPNTLLTELEVLENLVTSHILSSPHEEIILTADHGSTCMCLSQFGGYASDREMDPEHEGRYAKNDSNAKDDSLFFGYNDYYVALKHNLLGSMTHRLTHGGATPEEVLIPFIKIATRHTSQAVSYEIDWVSKKLDYSNKILKLVISPKPSKAVSLTIKGVRYEAEFKAGLHHFDLSDLEIGEHWVDLKIGQYSCTERIEVMSGFVEEDLFDE